ncbi:hypothetical protein BZG02_02775 [Labilibaculum filiforme]|uniref:HTH luxR-type domain-containing protein n=1 Tax=Labilibaculum filiforme TaxID=1940526 RepID=A0A2N3I3B5_9BACT|nr:hypothetical protein [Labilibaculum filiforme]PKQ64798.1 hypothetical protein BZG02_02775 [Labilibaculum filiforme]
MRFKISFSGLFPVITAFLYFYFVGLGTLQAQVLGEQLENGDATLEIPIDSSIFVLNKAYEKGVFEKDTAGIIRSLLSLSKKKRDELEFSDAFDHSGEALFLSEEYGDTILLAKVYDDFGMLNFTFNQEEDTKKYIEKSLELNRYSYRHNRILPSEMIFSYFHKMLVDLKYKSFDTARSYLDSCYMISDAIKQSPIERAYLDVKKATFLYQNNQREEGTKLLLSILDVFENSNENASESNRYLITIYSKLSEEYRKENEDSLALLYLNKANNLSNLYGKNTIQKAYLLERLAWIQAKEGLFEKAYKNIRISKNINESFFSTKRKGNSGFLQVKNRYREELINKDKELNRINLQLAEKDQAILVFRIVIVIFLFSLVLLVLIIRNKRQQNKYRKEKEVSAKQALKSKELLEIKNKELTASTLKLIEKEEIIKLLADQLNASKEHAINDSLMSSITKSSNSLWDDFNNRFISVNENFYERLRTEVPDLSPTDLKICALIKLNFSGKEMAHLLGISVNSVHMARHRLRKKMDLERNINLSNFISSI